MDAHMSEERWCLRKYGVRDDMGLGSDGIAATKPERTPIGALLVGGSGLE
jgi:hypothetical protein